MLDLNVPFFQDGKLAHVKTKRDNHGDTYYEVAYYDSFQKKGRVGRVPMKPRIRKDLMEEFSKTVSEYLEFNKEFYNHLFDSTENKNTILKYRRLIFASSFLAIPVALIPASWAYYVALVIIASSFAGLAFSLDVSIEKEKKEKFIKKYEFYWQVNHDWNSLENHQARQKKTKYRGIERKRDKPPVMDYSKIKVKKYPTR